MSELVNAAADAYKLDVWEARLMNNPGTAKEGTDPLIEKDLRILARFIEVYCNSWHKDQPRNEVVLKGHDILALTGRPLYLCESCFKLLAHAFYKRFHCPMHPKPACKHCPQHCYHPLFRQQIREVMKHSGRKLVLSGRLDYLWHLFS